MGLPLGCGLDAISEVLSLVQCDARVFGQFASAGANGRAVAACGLIDTTTGAIALNSPADDPGTVARLDLRAVLGELSPVVSARVLGSVSELTLEIGAVAASATIDSLCSPAEALSRNYAIGALHLGFASSDITTMGLRLGLTQPVAAAGLEIDVADGRARVEIASLLGASLNERAANTALFDNDGTTEVNLTERIGRLVADWADAVLPNAPTAALSPLVELLEVLCLDLFLSGLVSLVVNAQNFPAANNPRTLHNVQAPGELATVPAGQYDVAALRIGIRDALYQVTLYLARASVGPNSVRGQRSVELV